MDVRFDFCTSFSDGYVTKKDCYDLGGHMWSIAFIDFSGNWVDYWWLVRFAYDDSYSRA